MASRGSKIRNVETELNGVEYEGSPNSQPPANDTGLTIPSRNILKKSWGVANDNERYPTTVRNVEKNLPEPANDTMSYSGTPVRNVAVGSGTEEGKAKKSSVTRKRIRRTLKNRRVHGKKKTVKKVAKLLKGARGGFWLLSAYSWYYITIQLPLALLGLALLGAAAAVEFAREETFGGSIFGLIGEAAVNMILGLVGIDPNVLNPATLFFVCHFLLFLCNIICLLIIGFVYLFTGAKPIFGDKKTSLKVGAFIMCLVGMLFPLVNLLPWPGFWILIVWLYPE